MNKKERTMLALNLISHRKAAGLTQTQISSALGIDRSTYAYYETGTEPKLETLKKLAAVYRVSLAELLGDIYDDGSVASSADFNASAFVAGFNELSDDEKMIILKFRSADDDEKEKLKKLLLAQK